MIIKEVKVSEVINELKSCYEEITAIQNNKEYSPKQKEEMIKDKLVSVVEKINRYTK
jgi:lipopolysaccharide biosynthesis regulator YciM